MSYEFDHETHLALYSEMYPTTEVYNTPPQLPSQQPAEAKQKRRRRKAKKASDGNGEMSKKRKLSEEQANMLEMSFGFEHKLETDRKDKLAAQLGLDPKQVAVWFQNRRARYRNKKLEDEYSKLRCEHDSVVLHKSRLENELLKVKEELNEAHKEIQRLSEEMMIKCNHNSPTTPSSSSLTMDPNAANYNSIFQMDHFQDFNFDTSMYFQDHAYNVFTNLYPM